MLIRLLNETDAAAFKALRLEGLRDSPTAFGASLEESQGRPLAEYAQRLAESDRSGTFGAYKDGRLCGVVGIYREVGAKERHKAVIWGMYVTPSARRAGVARNLIGAALDLARRMDGLKQVNLAVEGTNLAAQSLYRSFGFVEFGREPRALYVDGHYYDELHMVLFLDEPGSGARSAASAERRAPEAAVWRGAAAERGGTRLRRLTRDDLPDLIALDDDPEVMRYLNGGLPADRRHIEEVVLPAFLAVDTGRPYLGVWAVETDSASTGGPGFIGWVSLRVLDATRPSSATLGFRFRRAAWGRGIATAAAGQLLAIALAPGEVERVVATTYQDNAGSRRVLEKLGFALVRRFKLEAAELATAATYSGSPEPWDGMELEYELTAPSLSRP